MSNYAQMLHEARLSAKPVEQLTASGTKYQDLKHTKFKRVE